MEWKNNYILKLEKENTNLKIDMDSSCKAWKKLSDEYKKRWKECEKKNAELKEKYDTCLRENTGLKIHNAYIAKKLFEAKELLKQFLEAKNSEDTYKAEWEAEQFLKDREVEK